MKQNPWQQDFFEGQGFLSHLSEALRLFAAFPEDLSISASFYENYWTMKFIRSKNRVLRAIISLSTT